MRSYVKIVILILAVFIVATVLAAVITSGTAGDLKVGEEDVLLLNDINKKAQENWGDFDLMSASLPDAEYVILSPENKILYDHRSDKSGTITVENAIKNRYPYSFVTKDNKVLGLAVLIDNGAAIYDSMRIKLIAGFAIAGLLITGGALFYGIYIHKNIIKPFAEMEEFAGKVAEGKLDEPLAMEKNNMFGDFTESFDIMREELRESKKREIALQKKEREMVASLSHDLKTPVTGIKLTAELLKAKEEMKGGDPDVKDKLDNIYKKADQIDLLVTDLFSSTLEDLGEFKVTCTEESASVLADIVSANDDKNLVCAGDIPQVIIRIDKKRMSQVAGNIIYNSYKYANTKIDIDYKLSGDFLEMRIRDHGPGVPADELELITNKFYRGKNSDEQKSEGSGLGLYIARILMEKMEGDLIPSSDGTGLCITLMIPLA